MIDAADKMDETDDVRGARERRDIVSGTVMPDSRLMRFVADPDGQVVPDAAGKLPGRGLWVASTRAAIKTAVEKRLFSRAAKAPVTATPDLADRTEKALVTARRQPAAGFRQCAPGLAKRQAAQGADRSL